jgi:hypothetical protein
MALKLSDKRIKTDDKKNRPADAGRVYFFKKSQCIILVAKPDSNGVWSLIQSFFPHAVQSVSSIKFYWA